MNFRGKIRGKIRYLLREIIDVDLIIISIFNSINFFDLISKFTKTENF